MNQDDNKLDISGDCNKLMKGLYESTQTTINQVKEVSKWIGMPQDGKPPAPGDLPRVNAALTFMAIHYLGLLPLLLNANTHATLRSVDLGMSSIRRAFALERLTKWIIGLTIGIILVTLPLAIEAAEHLWEPYKSAAPLTVTFPVPAAPVLVRK